MGVRSPGYVRDREPRRYSMNDSAWAGILMATLAVLIAVGFVAMWVRDRGRAREQATDSERVEPDPQVGAQPREGAAGRPHDISKERH